VINADNGPENNGTRTQWLNRLVQFSTENNVTVQLACYPPYHSKYNPVERVFGVLENYWNGDPLLTADHALGMAAGMTYKGVHPKTSMHAGGLKGVRLAKKEMRVIERSHDRLKELPKWFVRITPSKAALANIRCNSD
jgi:Rhodopirellula transposase DDE domain